MLEALSAYWAAVSTLFSDPRLAAAAPALVVSWGVSSDIRPALLCAFVAYSSIHLIIWLTSLPFGGEYTMPVTAASGVGTTMALMGLSEMQARVRSVKLTDVIKAVVAAIKGKLK